MLLIHERGSHPSDIRVFDELSAVVDGRSRRRVTTADIKKSKTAANTRSDDATESAKKTLTVIAQKAPTDAALQSFILAWFADLADNLVARQGLTPTLALNRLTALGLDDHDARRLVVSVSTGGGGSKGPDLASAKEMIAAGDLAGARRLYTSFIGTAGEEKDPVALQVAEALAAAEKRKQSALDAYHKAVEAKDYARARQALADAQAVDHEDTEIVRLLSQIPPDAPTNLRLTYSSNRNGVLLSWLYLQQLSRRLSTPIHSLRNSPFTQFLRCDRRDPIPLRQSLPSLCCPRQLILMRLSPTLMQLCFGR